MNNLPSQASVTMSSLHFLSAIINPARVKAGEKPHEPRHFFLKVEDELDLCATVRKFRLNNNQSKSYYYDLTKDQMLLVGMRESKAVRLQVLDKLNSIGASHEVAPFKLPATMAEALRLAADQAEQLEIAAPKVAFVDKYVAAEGNKGFRETAKLLSINEGEFRAFLMDNNIVYRLGGSLAGYAQHIDAGRLATKAVIDSTGKARNQALFTPKGVEWIAGLLARHRVKQSI